MEIVGRIGEGFLGIERVQLALQRDDQGAGAAVLNCGWARRRGRRNFPTNMHDNRTIPFGIIDMIPCVVMGVDQSVASCLYKDAGMALAFKVEGHVSG